MSVLQAPRRLVDVPEHHFTTRFPGSRSLALGILMAISLATSFGLARVTPSNPNSTAASTSFLQVWGFAFVPYAAACALVFLSGPASGRWRRVEIGLILAGAILLRVILLPLPPNLSHDSWRYVWDARVFLHGYSPYVTIPENKALQPLQDFIYANSRFRTVPSLYPPGAQYIYILSYLLVPSSLYFLKGVFLLFDLVSCVALVILLMRKGLDPSRALLYAWCPLPIVEFALQGHVDVLTITFTLLAALTASDKSRRGRVLTGFFVGMGTLTKIYPILMLAALVRWREWKRDWLLVLTCMLTIVTGYLPFLVQGHGQVFGFFGIYASEQGQNAGIIQHLLGQFGHDHHLSLPAIVTFEHGVAFLLVGGISLAIFLLRQSQRISLEAGTLALFGLVLAVSSHVFPWYTTTLLPWIVLLLPTRGEWATPLLLVARSLALLALWFFAALSVLSYVQDWPLYYLAVYDPLEVELILAALLSLLYCFLASRQKGTTREKRSIDTRH